MPKGELIIKADQRSCTSVENMLKGLFWQQRVCTFRLSMVSALNGRYPVGSTGTSGTYHSDNLCSSNSAVIESVYGQ